MMNSEIAKLYSRLNDNADKIENVGTKEEYLQLLANRKSIIKRLNELGEVVIDDIDISAIPIFEKDK